MRLKFFLGIYLPSLAQTSLLWRVQGGFTYNLLYTVVLREDIIIHASSYHVYACTLIDGMINFRYVYYFTTTSYNNFFTKNILIQSDTKSRAAIFSPLYHRILQESVPDWCTVCDCVRDQYTLYLLDSYYAHFRLVVCVVRLWNNIVWTPTTQY